MTKLEILIEAAEKATPGDWMAHGNGVRQHTLSNGESFTGTCNCGQVWDKDTCVAQAIGARYEDWTLGEGWSDEKVADNADFIAAAKNAMPEVKSMKDSIEWVLNDMHYTAPELIAEKAQIWFARLKGSLDDTIETSQTESIGTTENIATLIHHDEIQETLIMDNLRTRAFIALLLMILFGPIYVLWKSLPYMRDALAEVWEEEMADAISIAWTMVRWGYDAKNHLSSRFKVE